MTIERTGFFRALALAAVLFAASAAGAGERMTNADVIDMARAGIAPDLIVAKIQASAAAFDTSTRAILQLNENGVGDAVIKAMLAAPSAGQAGGASAERLRAELANAASPIPETREAAIAWMLANRAAVVPDLRSYLSEANPGNRAAAALALGRLGDVDSVGAIRNLLTDPDAEARKSAAQALALLNDQPAMTAAEQAIQRQVEPLDGFIRLVGYGRLTQASERLGQILAGNPSTANRAAAAWALGEIGRAGLAGRPALENALASDAEPEVRREAALALARYNDSASAASLQNACRADPAVRKTTLAALADYPEAVEFLVGVMALGPDQIAADESETARASLVRLTGQDFGLDGQRWNEWFAANRARFAAGPAASQPGVAVPALSPVAAPPPAGQPGHGNLDMMEAWSIIADSSAIPTAPLSGEAGGGAPAPGGVPSLPFDAFGSGSGGSAWDAPLPPAATSWVGGDVSGSASASAPGSGAAFAPAAGAGGMSVPTLIPDTDIPDEDRAFSSGALGGGASGNAGLRTWSSDPKRVRSDSGAAARPAPTPAAGDDNIPGWASAFEPVRSNLSGQPAGGDPFASGALDDDPFAAPPPAARPLAPVRREERAQQQHAAGAAPAFSAEPAADAQAHPADRYTPAPSGISLPLPPMMGGPAPSAPAPAGGDDPFAASSGSDPFAMPSEGDPFAAPADFPAAATTASPGTAAMDDPYADWSSTLQDADPSAGQDVWREVPYDAAASAFDAVGEPTAPLVPGESSPFDMPSSSSAASSSFDEPSPFDAPASLDASSSFDEPSPSPFDAPETDAPAVIGETPDFSSDMDAIDASLPVAPASPSEATADPGYRSDLFVEPEPGQIVVTDDDPLGRPIAAPATPAAPVSAPDPTEPSPFDAPPEFGDEPEAAAPLVVEPPAAAPAAKSSSKSTAKPSAAPATKSTARSTAKQEPFKSSSPAPVPPPPQPDRPAAASPQSQYLAPPPGSAGDGGGFMDPSKPLPPVRPEGTIAAPTGKDVPLLGEGFFK